MIKVRHAAGDINLARDFIRAVQPHVYTEQVNFAAIKTALVAREKMQQRRELGKTLGQPDETIDVKVDRGGIRDIEFLVQCLQRVYGGAEPWLRSGGTLFSLHKLHDKGHISGKEFHDLTSAYEFLRHLEHRRCEDSRPTACRRPRPIAGCWARWKNAPEEPVRWLTSVVQRRCRNGSANLSAHPASVDTSGADSNFTPRARTRRRLERLATDAPALYEVVGRSDLNPQARKNLYRFLGSAFGSSLRYATVLQHQQGIRRALALFETSDYLTEILIRHPEEIVTLAELERSA